MHNASVIFNFVFVTLFTPALNMLNFPFIERKLFMLSTVLYLNLILGTSKFATANKNEFF